MAGKMKFSYVKLDENNNATDAINDQPSITFNNGQVIPALGFGLWNAEDGDADEITYKALQNGYRHIDCARVYDNESLVGKAFHKFFTKNNREEVFITSKLWAKDFNNVREACNLTLKDLQLQYIDLYLIHAPFELDNKLETRIPVSKGDCVIGYDMKKIQEVWREMEKLVDDGLVKSIGISNFTIKKIDDLLSSSPRMIPACNQIEIHPYLPQSKLLDYCKEKDISVVGYSPLGNPGRPIYMRSNGDPTLFENKIIQKVAEKHQVTVAQVLIAWGLQRSYGVLVKTVREHRMQENFKCLDINLDNDDIELINTIPERFRFIDHRWALKDNESIEDLWDDEFLG